MMQMYRNIVRGQGERMGVTGMPDMQVDTMKIDVDTQCIITRENGAQLTINDVSSIAIVIEVMGQKYNIFRTIDELILNGRWK